MQSPSTLTTPGDAHPCPRCPLYSNSSTWNNGTPTSIPCDGKIAPGHVPGAKARTTIRGGRTTIALAAHATGATAASAPSLTGLTPCGPRASGRCRPGALRRFCAASRARRGGLPERAGGLVAAPCRPGLRDAASGGGPRGSGGTRSPRWAEGPSPRRWEKAAGTPRAPGRGHYDQDRPAISAWGSRQGAVVIQATRACTGKTGQKAADLAMHVGRRLYTDSASR
jgi:hypothetical protein